MYEILPVRWTSHQCKNYHPNALPTPPPKFNVEALSWQRGGVRWSNMLPVNIEIWGGGGIEQATC